MTYLWPSDDGWPYPDGPAAGREALADPADPDAAPDDDLLVLLAMPPHLFDTLSPVERQVITAHYGLNGAKARSMKELHVDLDMTRADVREALACALAKLRTTLTA